MLEPARGNLSQTQFVRTGPALSQRTREGQGTRFLGGESLGQPSTLSFSAGFYSRWGLNIPGVKRSFRP